MRGTGKGLRANAGSIPRQVLDRVRNLAQLALAEARPAELEVAAIASG